MTGTSVHRAARHMACGDDTAPPPEAYAAALAGLAHMGPRRLLALIRVWPPAEAWRRLGEGDVGDAAVSAAPEVAPAVAAEWRRAIRSTSVAALWVAHARAEIRVDVLGLPGYPALLAADHEPPAVLFSRGDPTALDQRRVGIVGTRSCTGYGRDMAHQLGRELAEAGVAVISGLALGVDGAAHCGSGEVPGARPVGVVGSGLDVVYPRQHQPLWQRVGSEGYLLSEAGLGARPEPWRFPARNRMIAALSEVIVVVEGHARGGSRHTVEAAEGRGRTVMAVPGSVRSSASAYPNQLLADGCPPARDTTDVLVALGLSTATHRPQADSRSAPTVAEEAVLQAVGWERTTLEEIVARSGRLVVETSVALVHLEEHGWVRAGPGWWERRP